ncbi:MAG: serine/threonine-protein phosphatase, partial [Verrucomicrobiota bacterium]|nr:serine/threonine-protein phosphatase [Verrucomicrobiota bacterium]
NGRSGPALGIFPDAVYHTCVSEMERRDVVLLFTDGLFEVESPQAELYSQQHLLAAVSKRASLPPEKLFEELLSEIRQFTNQAEFPDDVCLVGMEIAHLN